MGLGLTHLRVIKREQAVNQQLASVGRPLLLRMVDDLGGCSGKLA